MKTELVRVREENYDTLYRTLYLNNRDAVITFRGPTVIDANQAALDLFEITREKFIGQEISEFSLDKEKTKERVKTRAKGIPGFYLSKIQTKSGVKDIEVSSTPVNIGNVTSFGVIRDVTERLRAEHRNQVIVEHSGDLILVTNAGGVVFINPNGIEYLGLSSEEEIIGKSTLKFIHPDFRALAGEYSALRRAGGSPPNQYRSKMVRKDGKELDVEFKASYIDWEGEPSSLTIVRDISWQVQAENALIENQQRLSGFLEAATEGYSILDSDMKYLMVNDTELSYTGKEREEYIGRHILEVFPDLDGTDRYQGYLSVLETGEPIEYRRAMVLPERNLILNFSAFKAGDLLGIVAKDVTDQVRYQNRLEALHRYAQEISAFESRSQIARGTMDIINELLGFGVGAFGYIHDGKIIFTELHSGSTTYEKSLESEGITVRAVKTGETQLVNDTRLDPDYATGRNIPDVWSLSELDVPIMIDGKVVALINIEDEQANTFNEEDKTLVETIAAYVSSAISRIDYEFRLSALHDFALSLNQYESVDAIAEETISTIHRVFNIPFATIGVIRDGAIWFPYKSRLLPASGYNLPLTGAGVCVQAVNTGKTQIVEDVSLSPYYIDANLTDPVTGEKPKLHSEMAIPIFSHDQVFGVINMETTEKTRFSPETIRLMGLLGEYVSARLTSIRFESERVRAEQAEEMERIKTRFLSTATHELRTPLTSIQGYLELSKTETDLDTIRSYLDVAYRNAVRLEVLTRDLLDQQRIEEGRLEITMEPVEVRTLLSHVLEEVSALIERKGQHIKTEFPDQDIHIMGDEMRLGQVFVNLLDNASKYSPTGSSIRMTVRKIEDIVKISVSDRGSGLSRNDISKLFMPFPDIERPVISEKSVGLGLSICKGIVDLHGGRIWVESEGKDMGSTFHCSFSIIV